MVCDFVLYAASFLFVFRPLFALCGFRFCRGISGAVHRLCIRRMFEFELDGHDRRIDCVFGGCWMHGEPMLCATYILLCCLFFCLFGRLFLSIFCVCVFVFLRCGLEFVTIISLSSKTKRETNNKKKRGRVRVLCHRLNAPTTALRRRIPSKSSAIQPPGAPRAIVANRGCCAPLTSTKRRAWR